MGANQHTGLTTTGRTAQRRHQRGQRSGGDDLVNEGEDGAGEDGSREDGTEEGACDGDEGDKGDDGAEEGCAPAVDLLQASAVGAEPIPISISRSTKRI